VKTGTHAFIPVGGNISGNSCLTKSTKPLSYKQEQKDHEDNISDIINIVDSTNLCSC